MVERETYGVHNRLPKTLKITTATFVLAAWAVAIAILVWYMLKEAWQINPYAVLAPFLVSATVLSLAWALKTLYEEDIF